MKRRMSVKGPFVCFAVIVLMALAGCGKQGDDDRLHVMAFSDELYQQQDQLLELVNEDEAKLTVFPSVLERLVVELAGHEADILLVDGSLTEAIDPEGLVSLEGMDGVPVQLKAEETTVAVSFDSVLETSFALNNEAVLVLPVYSDKQADAKKQVKKWQEGEKRGVNGNLG